MNAQKRRVMVIPEEGIQALNSIIQEIPYKYAEPLMGFLGRFVQEEVKDKKDAAEKKMPNPKHTK